MPFLRTISADIPDEMRYPFDVASIVSLHSHDIELHPRVTFFVGENGSGKSTLLEALADKWGFAAESGNRSKNINLRSYHTELAEYLTLSRPPGMRPMDGFFLRAESLYNFATELEKLEREPFCGTGYFSYGGKSLHEQSHGESFFSIFMNRFDGQGIFMLDEPEAALSIKRQMAFLVRMHDLCDDFSQFIIATHSPIILSYPDCYIYEFSDEGIKRVEYEETDAYQLTKDFVNNRERMLKLLLEDE